MFDSSSKKRAADGSSQITSRLVIQLVMNRMSGPVCPNTW